MRGLREQPARVLANRPLEAAVEVFELERDGSAQRPHRPETDPARPLPLASLAQNLLASSVTAQCWGKLRGVCPDMPGRLPRLSTSRAYPLGLGLS